MASGRHLTACPGCGDYVPSRRMRTHVCDWWVWLDYQVHLRRGELERFEQELARYLGSPHGAFELWCAARDRLRAAQAAESASAARRASSSSTEDGSSPRAASST